MSHKCERVAIIGAGISGVVSGKQLLAAGCNVTIYERSRGYGGVWAFDERRSLEPPYPSAKPLQASCATQNSSSILREIKNKVELEKIEVAELLHAPPGPCYEDLKNNVATPLVRITDNPWPDGTENFVNHAVINKYIADAANRSGLGRYTRFNTVVERIWKEACEWKVASRTMTRGKNGRLSFSTHIEDFEAVVVASGHYHTMRVPDIPGLKEWRAAYPSRVHHSKGYRRAADYKDQNVLLIGAGTSSFDIARETGLVAKNVYQSSRGGLFDLPLEYLTPAAQRVGEVSHFAVDDGEMSRKPLSSGEPIPFRIHFKDGTALSSIHSVILCTGYHCTVPFLPDLHDDEMPIHEASSSPTILVTDGTQYHNLHKDIFYIPDPTLAFVGIPYYTATFTLFEFQAMAVAALFAGHADLPSEIEMRAEYMERVARKGYGRGFHSLKDRDVEYADEILGWVNDEGAKRGRSPIHGHTEEFKKVYGQRRQLIRQMLVERNNQVLGK